MKALPISAWHTSVNALDWDLLRTGYVEVGEALRERREHNLFVRLALAEKYKARRMARAMKAGPGRVLLRLRAGHHVDVVSENAAWLRAWNLRTGQDLTVWGKQVAEELARLHPEWLPYSARPLSPKAPRR